jgi:hypothetical protein
MKKYFFFAFLMASFFVISSVYAQKPVPDKYTRLCENWLNGTNDGKIKEVTLDDLKKNAPNPDNTTDRSQNLFTELRRELYGDSEKSVAKPIAVLNLGGGFLYFYLLQDTPESPIGLRVCLHVLRSNDVLEMYDVSHYKIILSKFKVDDIRDFSIKIIKTEMIKDNGKEIEGTKGSKNPVIKFEVRSKSFDYVTKLAYTMEINKFMKYCNTTMEGISVKIK